MILYRCLTSDEIIGMINDTSYNNSTICGENTFKYENDVSYKHFYLYPDHTKVYKNNSIIGQYIIPDDAIDQYGFGFYGSVKTERNDKLFGYYMPIPEVTVKEDDFKKKYLYSVSTFVSRYMQMNKLNRYDNEKYSEPILELFRGHPDYFGYTDYSYAEVYYEMVYQLALKNDMNFYKVVKILKDVNLYEEIKKYFYENKRFFEKQTKQYMKTKK